MNILYITTLFPREKDGDTIYTDLAEALFQKGHHVTVLCADPTVGKTTVSKERGMRIFRIHCGQLYNVGTIKKGVATLLLTAQLAQGVKALPADVQADLILYETPPLSVYRGVKVARYRFGAPTFWMLKDIFPDNGADLGYFRKNGILYKMYKRQERALLSLSDGIGCMSDANIAYLKKHAPQFQNKLCLFPNTKAPSLPEKTDKYSLRKSLGLPENRVIFLFGGNIGVPQCPDLLITLAKKISALPNGYFLAIGRGTHGKKVAAALADVPNTKVLPPLPRGAFDRYLHCADCGLVTLDSRFTIPNFPSRALSYMDAALPILAVTDAVCDLGDMFRRADCGYAFLHNEIDKFTETAEELCKNKTLRQSLGKNGRQYFLNHFTPDKSVALLDQFVNRKEKHK